MHTVFINTTKNIKIGGRFDALRSVKDLKKLMYVDCPLDAWNDDEIGYRSAAQQIADFIDTYNYVSNDYLLIVYVDLFEVYDLLKIRFFNEDSVEQAFLNQTCKSAISRLIAATILDKLKDEGREPAEMPVLVLELPKTKEVSTGIDQSRWQIAAALKTLGVAPVEALEQKFGVDAADKQISVSDLMDETKKGAKLDLGTIYKDRLQLLVDSVCKEGVPLDRACRDLHDKMMDLFNSTDSRRNLAVSEYYTNKKTQKLSLEVSTKHNFLMQCFILDCINNETAFNSANEVKKIRELSDAEWKTIQVSMSKKKRTYELERQKIMNLNDSYPKLGLASELYKLARSSFGLNESGNISTEFVVQDSMEELPKESKRSASNSAKETRAELVEQRGVVKNWFVGDSAYKPYDGSNDQYVPNPKKATSAADYIAGAKDLANHHLNIFNKLNMHVKRIMSNYSSRSISNADPVLRKRSVNMGENIADSEKNDYKYAERKNDGKLVVETEPTETVIETAKRSYISIMIEYLKFDAARGIAMKSIKEQCEWFINRVRRIESSLKKLFGVMLVLAGTLAAVYLPFVLIQWDSIVKNVDTLLVALASIGIPYALLFVFYFIARAYQKAKMGIAWEELIEKSQQINAENQRAISNYDALMTQYIPSLRWIYEYVLDVDFHCDCCDIARAKLTHHRDKLYERIEIVGNFLEDLDYSGEDTPLDGDHFVEYSNAFCEGETNNDFYAIIDKQMLDVVYKE